MERRYPSRTKDKRDRRGKIKNETRIIENNPDEIVRQIVQMAANSNELSTCLSSGGIQYSYDYFFDVKKKLLEKQKLGQHKGIRYITYIDRENIQVVKTYLKSGMQVRHIKNLPPMSFGVSDKQIAATIEKMEGGRKVQSLLISNNPLYLKHFATTFEELWKKGINASTRIREVEGGIEETNIEVIHNPSLTLERYIISVLSARQEVLLILPTAKEYIRHKKAGVMDILREALQEHALRVRILMPPQRADSITDGLKNNSERDIEVRFIEETESARATFLLVDKKISLIMEIRDDSKASFNESIGPSVYSTSEAGVVSYISIFENLWLQTKLYEHIKERETIQREFISVAAHELRTPVQPNLGLSEILRSKAKDDDQRRLVDVISRNSKKLQRLSEDILDVTRIDGKTLKLTKEEFDLEKVISSTVSDYRSLIFDNKNYTPNIIYEPKSIVAKADRSRITQVVSNLLSNAIKFTTEEEGTVHVTAEKKGSEIIVSVKDNGQGIDPKILPNLFTKFVTKSDKGTGLGLYISKSIVEAHNGMIWAENNSYGRGATFSFSLPNTT